MLEFGERAENGIDIGKIGNVVTEVGHGCRIDGRKPQRVDAEISAGRPALPVVDVLEDDMPIRIDEQAPLESLLGAEGLGRLGAMVAVDKDGVLTGVVTLAQVHKALRPAT